MVHIPFMYSKVLKQELVCTSSKIGTNCDASGTPMYVDAGLYNYLQMIRELPFIGEMLSSVPSITSRGEQTT